MGIKDNIRLSQVKWLKNSHYEKETDHFCMEKISLVMFKKKCGMYLVSRGPVECSAWKTREGLTSTTSVSVFFSLHLLPAQTDPGHFLYPQS